MRRVVDEVVRRPAADSDHLDAGPIHRVPAAVVVNQVVVRIMLAVRKRLFIATAERDAAIAHPTQVAAHDAMVRAAGNVHGEAARVTDRARGDDAIAAAADRDRGALAGFQHEPAQDDMRRFRHRNQAGRQRDHHMAGFHWRRRPEVKHAALTVQVPLPGLVELRKQVVGVEPLPLAHAEARQVERDNALLGIERLHTHALVRPVPNPPAVQHHILFAGPPLRAVALINEPRGGVGFRVAMVVVAALDLLDVGDALVWPARDGHRLLIEEDLEAGIGAAKPGWVGEIGRPDNALCAQISLPNLAARGRVEPCEKLRRR